MQTRGMSFRRDQGKVLRVGVIGCTEGCVAGQQGAGKVSDTADQKLRSSSLCHPEAAKKTQCTTNKQTTQDKPHVKECINREDIVKHVPCLSLLPITAKARLWRGGRRHGTGLLMHKGLLPPSRVLSVFTGMGGKGINLVTSKTWLWCWETDCKGGCKQALKYNAKGGSGSWRF